MQPTPRARALAPVSTLLSTTLLAIAVAIAVAGLLAPTGSAAADTPAPACGCAETGPYVAPIHPVAPYVSPDGGSAAVDPRYATTVTSAGGVPQSVKVTRVADQVVLGTVSLAHVVEWGFSPDQDRFVIATDPGTTVAMALYDLTRTPLQLYSGGMSQDEIRVGFSPRGDFLVSSLRGGGQLGYSLYRVTDGFVFRGGVTAPVVDATGAWDLPSGFSSDGDEFIGILPGTTAADRRYHLFDLTSGSAVTSSSTVAVPATSQLLFSPCGDMAARIDAGARPQVTLTNVGSGEVVATHTFDGPVELATTATEHVAVSGGVTTTLAPAADHCAPTWPSGATLTVHALSPDRIEFGWTAATDEVGVVGYRIVDSVGAAYGETAGLSSTLDGLQDGSYGFRVDARDAAGNWAAGPSVTFTMPLPLPTPQGSGGETPVVPQLTAPPAATGLHATALHRAEVRLTWSAAPRATAYVVQVRRRKSAAWRDAKRVAGTTATLGASLDRRTWFRVVALNAAGRAPGGAALTVRARR